MSDPRHRIEERNHHDAPIVGMGAEGVWAGLSGLSGGADTFSGILAEWVDREPPVPEGIQNAGAAHDPSAAIALEEANKPWAMGACMAGHGGMDGTAFTFGLDAVPNAQSVSMDHSVSHQQQRCSSGGSEVSMSKGSGGSSASGRAGARGTTTSSKLSRWHQSKNKMSVLEKVRCTLTLNVHLTAPDGQQDRWA